MKDYVKEILDTYDNELHKLYHMIHAYWYGTDEAKDGTIDLSLPYEEWAKEFIFDFGMLGDFEEKLKEVFKRYCDDLKDEYKYNFKGHRNALTEQRIKQMYEVFGGKELGVTLEQYREDFIDFYKKQIKYKVFNGTFDDFVEAGYNMQLTDF